MPEKWACKACTMLMFEDLDACTMCLTKRHNLRRRCAPTPSTATRVKRTNTCGVNAPKMQVRKRARKANGRQKKALPPPASIPTQAISEINACGDIEDCGGVETFSPESATCGFEADEITGIRRELLAWFDRHRRKLPWRGDSAPFTTAADVVASTEQHGSGGNRQNCAAQ